MIVTSSVFAIDKMLDLSPNANKGQLQLLFDKLTALIGGMQPQNWLSFPYKQTKGESK